MIKVWFLGDSTAADKMQKERPETGWGEELRKILKETIIFKNLSVNGQSTKSFLSSFKFEELNENIQKNDYVLIQFGHNDQKIDDKEKFSAPWTDFQANLITIIKLVLHKEAIPILLTSIPRRVYDNKESIIDTFGDYLTVVREVAAVYRVELIDMNSLVTEKLNEMSPQMTESLFMNIPSGVYKNYPDGKRDNTHFNSKGAKYILDIFVQYLTKNACRLKKLCNIE